MKSPNKLLDRKIFDGKYDKTLMWVIICLVLLGLIMIFSASVDGKAMVGKNNEYYYISRQAIFLFISVVVGLMWFAFVPMKKVQKYTPIIVGISLLLAIAVLFIGTKQGTTMRWISVFGLFNIQPAEIFKFAVVLYLASYLSRKMDVLTEFKKIWFVGIIPALGSALILLGGDLGSAVIVFVITISMLLMAGLRKKWFVYIIAIGLAAAVSSILVMPYRVQRILIFINPEQDPYGQGFQTIQSLIANARGGMFGEGLGYGMSRYYLPELHTDFIASIIQEELGAVYLIILCIFFAWIAKRAISIGKKASDLDLFYSSYVAKGIGIWIGVQAFLHIGVNVGVLPTKGLTLPFISYGGTSLLISILAVTVLLRIDYENRRKTLGYDI